MRYRYLPHIAFQVSDYPQAIRFYQDVMGMDLHRTKENETELTCGATTFYVENAPGAAVFLAFEVDDLESARRELIDAGCTVGPSDGTGCMVADPFGLRFYLSQA